VLSLAGAWQAAPAGPSPSTTGRIFEYLDPLLGGLVLGITMAAMLLGHWYLNTPTMKLAPLRRLLVLMAVVIVARMIFAGLGLGLESSTAEFSVQRSLFVLLRWLSGLFGALGLTWMAWQTLKIPNTQSATGILYVAVIATFLGELVSQLMSAESVYP